MMSLSQLSRRLKPSFNCTIGFERTEALHSLESSFLVGLIKAYRGPACVTALKLGRKLHDGEVSEFSCAGEERGEYQQHECIEEHGWHPKVVQKLIGVIGQHITTCNVTEAQLVAQRTGYTKSTVQEAQKYQEEFPVLDESSKSVKTVSL